MSLRVSWHLVPDGISSIAVFEVSGDFVVAAGAGAWQEAEAVMIKLVSRIADLPEQEVREAVEAGRWLGDVPRPPEPPGGRLRES